MHCIPCMRCLICVSLRDVCGTVRQLRADLYLRRGAPFQLRELLDDHPNGSFRHLKVCLSLFRGVVRSDPQEIVIGATVALVH